MDSVSSMFPCDEVDELFQFSSIPCQQHTIQPDTLLLTTPSLCNSTDTTDKPDYSRRQKSSVSFVDIEDKPGDNKKKKIIHRELEKQRRQEMAVLFRSLRSLMPPEHLKGKRSMSDHMHVAVNYIRDLRKRTEELSEKRDELKRSLNKSTINIESKCLPSSLQESVTVETSRARVRILVSTALRGGVPVSRVLEVLAREGLNVVSCISTRANERLLHTIESEVSDKRRSIINPSELQKKLADLVA